MNYYPPIEEILKKVDTSDKTATLLEVRKSWRSILSSMVFFIFAATAVVILNILWPDANLLSYFTKQHVVSLRWLGVIPALILVEIIRRYHDDLYSFSLHTLTHFDGRLSLNYTVPNIRYVDIRAVVVYQDIWGRMLDYGDLELDTAAQEKAEMFIQGVRDPEELADLIESFRQHSLSLEGPEQRNLRLNQD